MAISEPGRITGSHNLRGGGPADILPKLTFMSTINGWRTSWMRMALPLLEMTEDELRMIGMDVHMTAQVREYSPGA